MNDRWKIALTHTRFSYTGGIEKYIYSLVERLLEAGHEVHYFATKWEPYEHERLHFHRVPMVRFLHTLRVLTFNSNCNKLLAKDEYDIIHGFTKTTQQDVYTDGSGCLEEYIDATHWERSPGWRRWYRKTPHQRAIQAMESGRFQRDAILKIVPMAQFVADQILAHYDVDPARVEVIYNGVELEHFHPSNRQKLGAPFRREHGIAENTPVLLFVGNDWRRKGLDVVLEALAKLAGAGNTTPELLVAGHDNHPEHYQALAQKLGLGDRVHWLGRVREIRVPFAASDLFVFPSRYDVFGNVGLEALASGVPGLLSARAGVSEILDGGPGGARLEDPHDSEELARRMEEFLGAGDMDTRRAAARKNAERYSWDDHFDRLLEVYEEVLAEKRSGAASR